MTASAHGPYRRLERELQQRYPDLHLAFENEQPIIRGSFPVEHDGTVLDRFVIQMSFPDGPDGLPTIREIGGRIPRGADRHLNADGTICPEVPENCLLQGRKSLLEYLDGPVRNYFLGQMVVDQGEPWPFGQWSHGKKGLLEAYGELLGVTDAEAIPRYLDYLSRTPKGHWECPCGSGKRLRHCHAEQFRVLQSRIPLAIAKQARDRLSRA